MSRSRASSGRRTPPIPEPPKKVKKQQPPQQTVDQIWEAFTTKHPGRVHSVLPNNVYAETKAAKSPKGVVHSQKTGKSYDEAAAECRHAVDKIAKECKRVNMKYRDPHFDIEFDLKWGKRDTLDGLTGGEGASLLPKSVKRVTVNCLSGNTAATILISDGSKYSIIQYLWKKVLQLAMFVRDSTVIAGSCRRCVLWVEKTT